MNIRDAKGNDYDGIKQVQKTTWLATYPNEKHGITKKEIEARFSQPPRRPLKEAMKALEGDENSHYWVAEDNGKIVGFCTALRKDGKARIGAIYVLPDFQGQGIGGRLISRSFKWFGKDERIYVNVASYNVSSIKFYQKCGFVETGEAGISPASKLPFGSIIPEIEMARDPRHS